MDGIQFNEKIENVVSNLSKKGELKLFALNWRKEKNQWDVLVSADWINYEKMHDNISEIFLEVKKEFNGQFSILFSGIHPLIPAEPLVQNITRAFSVTEGIVNLEHVQFGNLFIEKMLLFVSRR